MGLYSACGQITKSISSLWGFPSLTGKLSQYIEFVRTKLFIAIFQKIVLMNRKA